MPDVLTEPAPRLSEESVRRILREHWQLEPETLGALPSERDLNVRVADTHVLKVSNPAEPAEIAAMEVAAQAHAVAADRALPVPHTVPAIDGSRVVTVIDELGRTCPVRLVTLLPGEPLEGRPITADLAALIGAAGARTAVALQGFFHAAAGSRVLDWDPRRLDVVLQRAGDRGLADASLLELGERLRPSLAATAHLPSGVLHADLTLTNVLAEGSALSGVIDFGDLHHTAYACDLAITLTSVLRNSATEQPVGTWDLAATTLDAYQRVRRLEPDEVELVGDLVLARLALSTLISRLRAPVHADNTAYITQYDDANTRVLSLLASLPPQELRDRFHGLAGTRTATTGPDLAARRRSVMGGVLSPLFYDEPLHVVRGEGPWLFTADGRQLLDAYNNVAVVGHAHPVVTQAVARQLGTLNTHSRYLHEEVVRLSERLVATMPEGLDTVLFTTSGTEANELAWRLATAYTEGERDGAVVAEHAYHGSTGWMADLSSNEWPSGDQPARVSTFPVPASEPTCAPGRPPAMVIADTGFTAAGVRDASPTYLRALVDAAHRVGALFVADEVQIGHGRTGPQLWRFALSGITPDVVTLGKPMGAGYPIGAVVTRREIADALARDYEYFSTFAATPAAAAAGNAVLDVLLDRGLPAQAVAVGDYLRTSLAAVRDRRPGVLGEIRGVGLLAGVDVASSGLAKAVVEGLVARGVLTSRTGPRSDVLKIRPPLVWEHAHVDLLCTALDEVLADVGARPGL